MKLEKKYFMKRLLNNNIIVLLILSSLGTACRKDKPIPEPPIEVTDTTTTNCDTCIVCDDFPPYPELGFGYFSEGDQYIMPFFNPNNEDEFIFVKRNSSNVSVLVKYNMSTNSETIICDTEHIISQPQWGEQGWIVFTILGNRIMKIYDDGSGLEQITFHESTYPSFGANGETFICMNQYPNLTTGYRPIIDLNGLLVDSVLFTYGQINTGSPYISLSAKYHTGYMIFADHSAGPEPRQGFCYYNNSTIQELNSFYPDYSIKDMTVSSTNLFYSEYWNDLYVIDLATNTTTTFLEGCQTKYYDYLSMSPNGNKMLVEKVINTPIIHEFGAVDIDEQHEIWIIDLVDKTETQILGE